MDGSLQRCHDDSERLCSSIAPKWHSLQGQQQHLFGYATSAVLSFPPLVTHMVSVPGAHGTNEGGALAGAACTTECHLLARLERTRGNGLDESFSFPSHGGLLHSCRRSTCAGRRRRPHPVVLKVTRAVAVLRDGGAWLVADPAPAQLLPFRRCSKECVHQRRAAYTCV